MPGDARSICCALLLLSKPMFHGDIRREKCLRYLPEQIGNDFFQMGNFSAKIPGAEALFSKIKTPKEAIVSLPVKMSGGGAATSKYIMCDISICGTPPMNNVGTLHFF